MTVGDGTLERRLLGRQLTVVADASVLEVLATRRGEIRPTGAVQRIAVTGAPGAGKSSLVGALVAHRLARDRRVGVLAIDPSSPRSGGSLLGDRIRIDNVVTDERLYVRSVPSRSTADGTTDNLPDLLAALERQPFDEIIVETVGVGQADPAVRRCVDSVVVVILPGSGDTIQAMKAGILEVGHVYVVHKADRSGAEQAADELRAALSGRGLDGWEPPVLLTSAMSGVGVAELSEALDSHREHLAVHRDPAGVAVERARFDVERLVTRRVRELVGGLTAAALHEPIELAYRRVIDELDKELPLGTTVDTNASFPPVDERHIR